MHLHCEDTLPQLKQRKHCAGSCPVFPHILHGDAEELEGAGGVSCSVGVNLLANWS